MQKIRSNIGLFVGFGDWQVTYDLEGGFQIGSETIRQYLMDLCKPFIEMSVQEHLNRIPCAKDIDDP